MIAKILVLPFGGIWKLKNRCFSVYPMAARVFRVIYGFYQYENNSSIAWNSIFTSEPCFPHGMKSIFISGEARIGRDCVIFQQVTIGSVTLSDSNGVGSPTIGDNVYIGSGAKIVGGVNIGNNVRIGANAVVYRDVPDNSTVVSGEQKILTREALLDNRIYAFHGKWMYFEKGKFVDVINQDVLKKLSCSFNEHKS